MSILRIALCLSLFVVNSHSLRCAFIHGLGVSPPTPSILNGSFTEYWGNVHKYTPACDEHLFFHANTVLNPWNSTMLQQWACWTATGGVDTKAINDTVIFTHSMGNLIFSAALLNGFCEFGSNVFWYQVSGPFEGSIGANNMERYCNGSNQWTPITRPIADAMHVCYGPNASPALKSNEFGYPGLPELVPIARKFSSGALCGISAGGIPGIIAIGMSAVSRMLAVPAPSDGIVPFNSCAAATPQDGHWAINYTSNYYQASVNHLDTACREGDDFLYPTTKSPCKWYGVMTKQAKQAIRGKKNATANINNNNRMSLVN